MKTSETSPIRVDFVDDDFLPAGRLGVTIAPGKKQVGAMSGTWDRDLQTDLQRLRGHYRCDTLVCLVEEEELHELEIASLPEETVEHDIDFVHYPVPDFNVPEDLESFGRLVDDLIGRIGRGETVVIHCKGGLGRSGTLAACCLRTLGHTPESSLRAIRNARPDAVENALQESFVTDWASGGSDDAAH